MRLEKNIRKAVSIPLYLLVVYYLLPFEPGYIYHVAQYNPTGILNEIKKEEGDQSSALSSLNKSLSQSDNTFHRKGRVKFYFRTGFAIVPAFSNQFIFSSNEIISFLIPSYQPPLVIFISSRGPPLA